jgi:hypothetical protein
MMTTMLGFCCRAAAGMLATATAAHEANKSSPIVLLNLMSILHLYGLPETGPGSRRPNSIAPCRPEAAEAQFFADFGFTSGSHVLSNTCFASCWSI